MKKLLIMTMVLMLSSMVFSQDEGEEFVKTFPDKWQFNLINSFRDFNQLAGIRKNTSISYRNTTYNIGARLRFKRFGLAAHFPVNYFNPSSGDRSASYGMGFSVNPGNYNLAGSARFVKGFEQRKNGEVTVRSDVNMIHLSGSAGYVFNNGKFSMRAPFKFFEIQKVSAGSFMALVTANYVDMHAADSLRLFDEVLLSNVNRMRILSLGAGAGYGHTFTKGDWFMTPLISVVAEMDRRRYLDVTENVLLNNWRPKPVLINQLSMGYNSEKYFLGLVMYYRPGLGSQANFDTSYYRLRISLMAGFRFDRLIGKN